MTICTLRRVLRPAGVDPPTHLELVARRVGQRGEHVAQARPAQLGVEHQRGDDQVGAGVVEVVGELLQRRAAAAYAPGDGRTAPPARSGSRAPRRSRSPGSPARGRPRRRWCRAATRSRPPGPPAGRSRPARRGAPPNSAGQAKTSSAGRRGEHRPAGEQQDQQPGSDGERQPGADALRRAERAALDGSIGGSTPRAGSARRRVDRAARSRRRSRRRARTISSRVGDGRGHEAHPAVRRAGSRPRAARRCTGSGRPGGPRRPGPRRRSRWRAPGRRHR